MRQKWIDVAKGIAILCVIIGHVNGGNMGGPFDLHFVFGFHLTVFFILSGYTLKRKTLNSEYVAGKFLRLMVPYFITCFAVMAMDVFKCCITSLGGGSGALTSVIATDLVRSFFASGTITSFVGVEMGTHIGAIWFLPAMFFALLIMQALLQVTDRPLHLGLTTGAFALLGFVSARFFWLPFSIQAGMMASFLLWVGYEVRRRDWALRMTWRGCLGCVALFAFGVWRGYDALYYVSCTMGDLLMSLLVSVAGSMAVLFVARKLENVRFLEYCGRNSLVILCAHLFALETLQGVFWRLAAFLPAAHTAAVLLMNIAFALVATFVLLWAKDKVLSRRVLKEATAITATAQTPSAIASASAASDAGAPATAPSSPAPAAPAKQRDAAVDAAKGIFILAMLVGHFSIDPTLRGIIYSCHMAGFVLLSGYFYKRRDNLGATVAHIARAFLVPYAVFAVLAIALEVLLAGANPLEQLQSYALGMSFGRRILSDIASVGPVYFLLMLFATRVIYLLVDRVCVSVATRWGWSPAEGRTDALVTAACLALSWFGAWLGHAQLWLPWSLDLALYCLSFYQIGYLLRRYQLLEALRRNPAAFFVLVSVWAYMVYAGSMELAIRALEPYGLVIIGAVCGTCVVYQLASYISDRMGVVGRALSVIGQATLYILILTTLFSIIIQAGGSSLVVRLLSNNAFSLVFTTGLGVLIWWLVGKAKARLKARG